MSDIEGNWLRLNEVENAINNLEMVRFLLDELRDPIRWKWAIIALHQSLYSFAICATTPTDSSLSLKKPTDPNSRLIGIWKALERARNPEWIPRSDWTPLVTTSKEDEAINKIVSEFRNEFEHFKPKGWSIEVTGMPQLFSHVLRVIQHLALESNNVLYLEEREREHVRTEIDKLMDVLRKIDSA